MIIVEGPDHVGKTTFCKLLQFKMHQTGHLAQLLHMSKPPDDFDYYQGYLRELRPGNVYDRFHYGAYVYGATVGLHPVTRWSFAKMELVHRYIHLQGGLVVLLYAPDDVWYSQHLDTGKDEMFDKSSILKANLAFQSIDSLVDGSKLRTRPDATWRVGPDKFPNDKFADRLVESWLKRNATVRI